MAKEWMRPSEVAKALGISRGTIYLILGRKEIPYYRVGHSMRILKKDFEKYVEEAKNK